jgi:protease I
MQNLTGLRVMVIATDGVEESELTEPVLALKEAGALVDVLSDKLRPIQAFRKHEKSIPISVDGEIKAALLKNYDAVLLPGGVLNAETLRMLPEVRSLLRQAQAESKPIAAICHAPWELVSAGLVHGRTLTSYSTIQDDIRNAGGNWVDQEVVIDDNWITSRQPSDITAFNHEMINLFAKRIPSAGRS